MKYFTFIILAWLASFFSATSHAQPPKEKQKIVKEKKLPPGLQKKLERGGELPPGWQKKLIKGEILEESVYRHATPIDHHDYPHIPVGDLGTVVVKIDDRLVRLIHATHEIVDILN